MSAPAQPSEAEIIAAEFPTVTLLDGTPLTLSGSMANTRLVERRYGSLGGLVDVFNGIAAASEDDDPEAMLRQQIMTPVIEVMACFTPRGPLRDPDELGEHLDGRRIGEYIAALGDVIRLAFPAAPTPPTPAPVDGPGNDGSVGSIPRPPLAAPTTTVRPAWIPTTTASPGVPSTTPPPSYSDGPTPSSG